MPNARSKTASPKHTPFDKEPVAPPSRPSPFYLRTLGDTSLRRAFDSDATETLLDAGKPLALIAFVASSPGHSARREQLVASGADGASAGG